MTLPKSAPGHPAADLSSLAHDYDVLLCDVWGVVHNGLVPYPMAVEALSRFRAGGGRVVFITNAPYPSADVAQRLDEMAVPRSAWDAMVSSGDVSRAMIGQFAGGVVHHAGPAGLETMLFSRLDVRLGPVEAASAVVISDLETDDDTVEDYRDRMAAWLERGLPLICANPDKVVEVGDRLVFCGGAVADAYAEMGGEVLMAGKPYPAIYDEALLLAAQGGIPADRSRVLAIGDSVRTDAHGAARNGLDLLFITGSIHAVELDAFGDASADAVALLVSPSGARLVGFMPRLVWTA